MKLRIGKKALTVPLHWIIIFVVFLLIIIIIAVSAYNKSGGLLGGLFSAMRGG